MDAKEIDRFRRFNAKGELDKALHSLEGILKGICIDESISMVELAALASWSADHATQLARPPYSKLVDLVRAHLAAGRISGEDHADLLWLLSNLRTDSIYFDVATSDIQRLEGMLHGILSDGKIDDTEIRGLRKWLLENEQLQGLYPFDELCSIVVAVLADGKVDEAERDLLKVFFSSFVDTRSIPEIDQGELAELRKTITIGGVCSLDPELEFSGKTYCFTGASKRASRKQFAEEVAKNGGTFKDGVSLGTDYLIIGSEGNPCWAFSTYGRKVELAMEMRRSGHPIVLVSEIDFWDRVAP